MSRQRSVPLTIVFDTAPPRQIRSRIEDNDLIGDSHLPKKINRKLRANYVIKNYHAKIVYMQSVSYRRTARKALHVQRWKSIADEVDVHVTPGTHKTMFDMPHVQVLAHLVQTECHRATAI